MENKTKAGELLATFVAAIFTAAWAGYKWFNELKKQAEDEINK